jgi:hypothetical protein
MFVRRGLTLALTGVVCGLAAAVALTRLMASLLFGTSPLDPAIYVLVALGLTSIAALASYVPARRAALDRSRADPARRVADGERTGSALTRPRAPHRVRAMLTLEGRVALVTGGSRGIGRAISVLMGSLGRAWA